jgi:CxxC motif-containing protein (DUF1111 family)
MKAQLPVPSVSGSRVGSSRGALRSDGVGSVSAAQAAAPDEPTVDNDGVPDPELSAEDLFDLVSFSMLLAAPQPDPPTPETEEGRALFDEASCSGCHVPSLAGPRGSIPAYSDLLLHDMGEELADHTPFGQATGREFRTQPLWGVAAVAPYLHDGRADTLDEAIRFHGGEAQASRDAYVAMTDDERAKVIAFLESLGGLDQKSEGLIPPDAAAPEPGTLGGPMAGLSEQELARFETGRRLFDQDMSISGGLGPSFNGDSCRACHFDPAVGGSGPADVDVTRQGILDPSTGEFTFPEGGTMAHRHAVNATRPRIDERANVFETRQTPSILGLGLVDRIPEETILAMADPDDMNNDGISGRAHVLVDGRLGRNGWKANVPNLREFARDGMFNELGITLPDQEGLSFGGPTDDDAAPDPEITAEELDALAFFMEQLAPPPRTRTEPAKEDAGEALFAQVGCADCHVPSLDTADGAPVPLYSDLLLHDVAAPDANGIEDGDASYREFRTPPLWGLHHTAPYMHDGRSFTVEDAIARHDSEAAAARDGYMMLSAEQREQVIAFLRSL